MLSNNKTHEAFQELLRKDGATIAAQYFGHIQNTRDTERIVCTYTNQENKVVTVDRDSWVPKEMVDKVILFGAYFMPDYFRDSSPDFHRMAIAMIMSEGNEYSAYPRGFSKTTILQLCVSYICAYKLRNFIVVIEKSFTEAAEVVAAIRENFITCDMINDAFGNLVSSKSNNQVKVAASRIKDAEWDFWINGVRIKAKWFETNVRGIKSWAWRPDLILCDDIEKDEHIDNPEQRQKYLMRYTSSIIPAVDKTGAIKVQGTILHMDSLLSKLINMHDGVLFRAFYTPERKEFPYIERRVQTIKNRKYKLLWPSRWDYETLEQKKNDMLMDNKSIYSFTKEYLNDPVGDEARNFKANWLWNPKKRMSLDEWKALRIPMNWYAAFDMADSTTPGADYTWCVVMFADIYWNMYRVDVRREKRDINGVIDLVFDIWGKWQPHGLIGIGIEKRAYNDQVRPLLDEAKHQRWMYPVVDELQHMGRTKNNRILGNLQGRYQSGKIFDIWEFQEGEFFAVWDTEILKQELYTHPSSQHDDLSDAEAYAVETVTIPLGAMSEHNYARPSIEPTREDPFTFMDEWTCNVHYGTVDDNPF